MSEHQSETRQGEVMNQSFPVTQADWESRKANAVLLPCPFCGGKARYATCLPVGENDEVNHAGQSNRLERVSCYGDREVGGCSIKPWTGWRSVELSEVDAITAWNTRVASADAQARDQGVGKPLS